MVYRAEFHRDLSVVPFGNAFAETRHTAHIVSRRPRRRNYPNLNSYLIKNYLTLDAKILTTFKVNKNEREEIIKKVKSALADNFNAKTLEYGQEIPLESLISVIKNADSRIKDVSLFEPDMYTKVMWSVLCASQLM